MTTTLAPSAAKRKHMALQIPFEHPVTMATFPERGLDDIVVYVLEEIGLRVEIIE